jgi:nucleotide-binding universal stress UspA family protein
MEYTLPDEYLDETELERQRKIHDSLITMGLKLISDSYLEQMDKLCKETGLPFTPKMMDGKHHAELIRDIAESDYDLVVLGALGVGRVRDSQIGSVCERVTRSVSRDVWVVKHVPAADEVPGDTILVGIDGSPQSFGALFTAIELGRKFGKKVEIIGVYDPYLHYSVFNGIVNVLTEKAAKVFRFEEQNQLHEEIIDTGLAQIYQSHLEVAERMAAEQGVEVKKTLLDGKAFQKILDHARKTSPWLLVLGRIGVHSAAEETGLGSNAENLLRTCPCDVLLTTRTVVPELDLRAEESIRWTPEAEERMKRVPPLVKGIARTGVLRLAVEKGHSVITNAVIDEAMDRFMPKYTKDVTTQLAEAVALERAKSQPVSLCKGCGVAAVEASPVRCAVCAGTAFEVLSPEMLARIAAVEGGLEEETTYDGRKLKWSEDARRALWTMKDAYQRRRAKARVEKTARMRRLDVVTLDFARMVIEEETGVSLGDSHLLPLQDDGVSGSKLIARDDKNVPLTSTLDWTPDAVERILRVPSGFMRTRTQERIEALARERELATIPLDLVEEGIAVGRQLMEEAITGYQKGQEQARAAYNAIDVTRSDAPTSLNEVGVMSEMARLRAKS